MLELRPNCEYCDRDLPADSLEARICSYECTFCADCVDNKLNNVCPNCGGGFVPRPIRPASAYRAGVSRQHQPPAVTRVQLKFDTAEIAHFVAGVEKIPPERR